MTLPATVESGLAQLAQLEGAGAVTPTGLVPSKLAGLTMSEYESLGRMLGRIEKTSIWLIGDWLNLGPKLYGDDFYQVAEAVGLRPQTLTNRRSICDRIPHSRRRLGVDFSTHAEVAYLPAAEQAKWLKLAEEGDWSSRRLRKEIRQENTDDDGADVLCTCPVCGNDHSALGQN